MNILVSGFFGPVIFTSKNPYQNPEFFSLGISRDIPGLSLNLKIHNSYLDGNMLYYAKYIQTMNFSLQGVSYWFVPNQLALFLSKINNLVIIGVLACCLDAEI